MRPFVGPNLAEFENVVLKWSNVGHCIVEKNSYRPAGRKILKEEHLKKMKTPLLSHSIAQFCYPVFSHNERKSFPLRAALMLFASLALVSQVLAYINIALAVAL